MGFLLHGSKILLKYPSPKTALWTNYCCFHHILCLRVFLWAVYEPIQFLEETAVLRSHTQESVYVTVWLDMFHGFMWIWLLKFHRLTVTGWLRLEDSSGDCTVPASVQMPFEYLSGWRLYKLSKLCQYPIALMLKKKEFS